MQDSVKVGILPAPNFICYTNPAAGTGLITEGQELQEKSALYSEDIHVNQDDIGFHYE